MRTSNKLRLAAILLGAMFITATTAVADDNDNLKEISTYEIPAFHGCLVESGNTNSKSDMKQLDSTSIDAFAERNFDKP